MTGIARISPEDARQAVTAGRALLVCAYDDEATYRNMRLEGAISLAELRSRLAALPKEQEIVFYCA